MIRLLRLIHSIWYKILQSYNPIWAKNSSANTSLSSGWRSQISSGGNFTSYKLKKYQNLGFTYACFQCWAVCCLVLLFEIIPLCFFLSFCQFLFPGLCDSSDLWGDVSTFLFVVPFFLGDLVILHLVLQATCVVYRVSSSSGCPSSSLKTNNSFLEFLLYLFFVNSH